MHRPSKRLLLDSALWRRNIREVVPEIVLDDAYGGDGAVDASVVEIEPQHDEQRAPESMPRPVEASIVSHPALPDDGAAAESTVRVTCEIALWRGYRNTHFYARTFVDDEEVAVLESPSFRARGKGTLDRTEEAVAAHEALSRKLREAGWTQVAAGRLWYGDIFQRDVIVAEAPAPPP